MRIKQKKIHNQLVSFMTEKSDPYLVLEKEVGPEVKAYRKKWELTSARKKLFKYPLHLNIELSYGCNMRCSFCIFSLPKERSYYKAGPKDSISFSKYRQIIDEGAKNGLCSVALNGYNEPLLKKDIARFIRYAKNKGILDISLHTNGQLLDPVFSRQLITSGLTSIMFSVDAATKRAYKKIRGSEQFARVVKNIDQFIKIKRSLGRTLPLVRMSFVETKANIKEKEDFFAFWKDKADYFAVQSFSNPFVGLPGYYQKAESDYRLKDTPFSACAGPYQRLTIACDGNVYPCCSYYGLYLPVGNIHRDPVSVIWKSELLNNLRSNINSPGRQPQACRKCRASFRPGQGLL